MWGASMEADPCAACPVANLRRERERERILRRAGNPDPVTVAIAIALLNVLFLVVGYVLAVS